MKRIGLSRAFYAHEVGKVLELIEKKKIFGCRGRESEGEKERERVPRYPAAP